MDRISLRNAVLEDLSDLLEFEQGIIVAERPMDSTLAEDPISYYDIKELIESSAAEVVVAEAENRIIASGYAKIENAKPYLRHERFGYLGFMYVLPAFRGRGVNKLILEELLQWLRSQNIDEVRLDVYDQNKAAIRAYEKVGFQPHLLNMRMSITKK